MVNDFDFNYREIDEKEQFKDAIISAKTGGHFSENSKDKEEFLTFEENIINDTDKCDLENCINIKQKRLSIDYSSLNNRKKMFENKNTKLTAENSSGGGTGMGIGMTIGGGIEMKNYRSNNNYDTNIKRKYHTETFEKHSFSRDLLFSKNKSSLRKLIDKNINKTTLIGNFSKNEKKENLDKNSGVCNSTGGFKNSYHKR